MAKKPEDYFNELAKVNPSPTGLKPIAYNRPKKGGLPTGLILLIVGGLILYSFVHYFSSHDPKDLIASVVKELPDSTKAKLATVLAAHHLMSPMLANETSAQGTPTQPMQTTATSAQSAAATQTQRTVATAARSFENNYVEIDGKWYKKNSSNVYMVNGHPVFYVDDHRMPAPAQSPKK